ncbi:helix-turn-helix domain-containing protein [Amycolatopsis sp. BJA-103]|uniref:helix-turn-helix domain-containing protein n=1 Tax=Amycolatopsis sp. BJA-103 TaxID=1911175 RepID=UPI0011AF4350
MAAQRGTTARVAVAVRGPARVRGRVAVVGRAGDGSQNREPDRAVDGGAVAAGLSERQLRRRFLVAVGLSPKAYARVVRLHRAMALARSSSVPDWASCVRFFQAAAG